MTALHPLICNLTKANEEIKYNLREHESLGIKDFIERHLVQKECRITVT